MKQQGRRCYSCRMCDTQTLEITQKSLFTLYYSNLAWMEQSEAGINAHSLL